MDSPTHYELLCVSPEASEDDIRSAYRRVIRVYHPDVASEAGSAMTRRLNDAQRVLLDPTSRARYDVDLRNGSAGARSSAAPRRTADEPPVRTTWDPPYTPPRRGTRPTAARTPVAWNPVRYGAWATASFGSLALILIATIVVFSYCYSGQFWLTSAKMLPPVVIAIAWLVAVMSKTSKLFVVLLTIGAAIGPLAAVGVEPFTVFGSLPSPVLALVTATAVAVVVLRIAAPHFTELERLRPRRRRTAAA